MPIGYAGRMTGYIFHWWLGLGLLLVSILAVVASVAGYLKKVVAPQYPGKRNKRED